MHSILFLSLVARCLETISVCIWRMFVFMSDVVIVSVHLCGGMWECLMCIGRC